MRHPVSPSFYDAADPFGSMSGGRKYPHTGSDYTVAGEVYSVADAVVESAGWNDGNGNYVCCWLPGFGIYVAYLHLSSINVKVGQSVKEGTKIGVSGNTGTNSRGTHLHITMSDSPQAFVGLGNKIDPYAFIQANLGSSGIGSSPAPLAVDGDFGRNTIRALQSALGVTVDGDFGRASVRALQVLVGATVDGDWGPGTTRALQAFLGVAQDGDFGPQTIRALQTRLNAGTFVKPAPAKPEPVKSELVKPEPVKPEPVKPEPAKPIKPEPAKPAKPTRPVPQPSKPESEKPVPNKTQAEQIAAIPSADLGVIIQKPSHRQLAYALYSLASLVVTNAAVAYAALGAQFPPVLTVAIAIIGNLAVPFSALAIANAKK
jgi:murein DD-endopeptidase MepM/ murein hydrolase activator NlpD